MNGTTASIQRMGTKPSSTMVDTWMPTKASTSSDRLRCRATTTNRGSRDHDHPTEVTTPSSSEAVSSNSVTTPAPRVRYQSALGGLAAARIAIVMPRRPAPSR